jgi:hypothetical protein
MLRRLPPQYKQVVFTMNKEKEALLKAILAQPDVPRKVASKNVLRFVDRMKPETEAMRDYLMAIFSSETDAESDAISKKWYAKMTPIEQKVFSEAFYRCCMNQFHGSKEDKRSTSDVFSPSV